jgi:hypothetical protein
VAFGSRSLITLSEKEHKMMGWRHGSSSRVLPRKRKVLTTNPSTTHKKAHTESDYEGKFGSLRRKEESIGK